MINTPPVSHFVLSSAHYFPSETFLFFHKPINTQRLNYKSLYHLQSLLLSLGLRLPELHNLRPHIKHTSSPHKISPPPSCSLEQLLLRLVEYTLYSHIVICLYTSIYYHYWCTHFGWPRYSALQMKFTLVLQNLFATTVHSLVLAQPLFCQPITEQLQFTCFTLIGPLVMSVHEGYLLVHEGYLPVHEGYIWFMRVIFRFRGVICFLYSMLTTSFPYGKGRGKNICLYFTRKRMLLLC